MLYKHTYFLELSKDIYKYYGFEAFVYNIKIIAI